MLMQVTQRPKTEANILPVLHLLKQIVEINQFFVKTPTSMSKQTSIQLCAVKRGKRRTQLTNELGG